jgi:hypothetical protein
MTDNPVITIIFVIIRRPGMIKQYKSNTIMSQTYQECRKFNVTETVTLRARRPAALSSRLLTKISAVYGAASIDTQFLSVHEICALQAVPQESLRKIYS